jgi:Flp pilus assembly protein TadG
VAARRRRARRDPADGGGVTAEFAVALPALLLMVTFAIGAVDAVLTKVQCVDAARDAALVAARGGDGEAAARARAPRGATVRVTAADGTVRVNVTVRVTPLGVHLGGFDAAATAVATIEPGAP